MFHRFVQRLLATRKKIAERGWGWFWQRASEKCVDPHSPVGRRMSRIVSFLGSLRGPVASGDRRSAKMEDTLFFFYDLQVAPITFNVIDEFAGAELARRRLGLSDIHFVVVPGRHHGLRWEDPDYDSVVDHSARNWRIHNILINASALLPSCSGHTLCGSRQQAAELQRSWAKHVYPEGYSVSLPIGLTRRNVVERITSGEAIFPMLVAPVEAMRFIHRKFDGLAKGRRVVAITLRSYPYMTQRNSRLESWTAFARSLDPEKYLPVFVPDAHSLSDPVPDILSGFIYLPEVAINLQLRMALVEYAWLNIAQMHGPMELCWYSEHGRYLVFQVSGSAPQTEKAAMEREGFDVVGGQIQWAKPYQRWVWEPDDLDVIQRHFREMEQLLETIR